MERGRIQGLSRVLKYPLLSQKWYSYGLQILYALSYDRSQQKPINNFGKSSRGCSQGLPKFFRASIYRAHRAVIFAIARLSCLMRILKIIGQTGMRRNSRCRVPYGVGVEHDAALRTPRHWVSFFRLPLTVPPCSHSRPSVQSFKRESSDCSFFKYQF